MGDHRLPKRFPPIDARAEPRVMGYPLSARRRQRRATSLIGFAMVGVFSGSIVLTSPPQAWADHDPQAIWGLVPESHGVRVTKPPRSKIKDVKERRAAKKQSHGQLTKTTSISTPKKEPKVPLSAVLAKEAESPGFTVAEAQAAETDRLRVAPQIVGTHEAAQIHVTIGTSHIVDLPGQLQRASVTNPEVANIQIVPPNQILVNGKSPGITTLIAWLNGERRYFDIVVQSNL